jgi:hypothetical protein
MERNIIINDVASVSVQYLSQILYNLFASVEQRPSFDIERNIYIEVQFYGIFQSQPHGNHQR